GKVVFIFAWNADVADVNRRLNRAGAIHEIYLAFIPRGQRWILISRHSSALPTTKSFFDLRKGLVHVDVANNNQMGCVWNVITRDEATQICACECTDRLFIRHDKTVGMVAEYCLLEALVNQKTRVSSTSPYL